MSKNLKREEAVIEEVLKSLGEWRDTEHAGCACGSLLKPTICVRS